MGSASFWNYPVPQVLVVSAPHRVARVALQFGTSSNKTLVNPCALVSAFSCGYLLRAVSGKRSATRIAPQIVITRAMERACEER